MALGNQVIIAKPEHMCIHTHTYAHTHICTCKSGGRLTAFLFNTMKTPRSVVEMYLPILIHCNAMWAFLFPFFGKC